MKHTTDNIQIDPNTGKWISIFIKPEHILFVMGLKTALKERNLKVSQNEIANRLLELGMENIDKDEVLKNPLSLWEGK